MEKKHSPLAVIMFSLLVSGIVSCSTSPPKILDVFHQLDVVRDVESGAQHEEFSFFLLVDDDDGTGDIHEIILTHTEEELQWRLTSEEWREVDRDGELWIGGSGFRRNNENPVPRGKYLVEVVDKGSESAQSEFFISPDLTALNNGPLPDHVFPQFQPGEDRFIKGGGDQVSVFLSSRDGSFLKSETVLINDMEETMLQQWKAAGAASFQLHSYLEDRGFGVVNGPFQLPEVP